MKFTAFKEFRFNNALSSVVDYLSIDLKKFLREMQLGLTRLRFGDNFESFEATVTIPALGETIIRNELPSGSMPTQRLIVRGGTGSEQIVDGDTEWTADYVYLKNQGASDATVTVIFLR